MLWISMLLTILVIFWPFLPQPPAEVLSLGTSIRFLGIVIIEEDFQFVGELRVLIFSLAVWALLYLIFTILEQFLLEIPSQDSASIMPNRSLRPDLLRVANDLQYTQRTLRRRKAKKKRKVKESKLRKIVKELSGIGAANTFLNLIRFWAEYVTKISKASRLSPSILLNLRNDLVDIRPTYDMPLSNRIIHFGPPVFATLFIGYQIIEEQLLQELETFLIDFMGQSIYDVFRILFGLQVDYYYSVISILVLIAFGLRFVERIYRENKDIEWHLHRNREKQTYLNKLY